MASYANNFGKGAVGGLGKGLIDLGTMTMKNNMEGERERRLQELRGKTQQAYGEKQNIARAKEGKLDRDARINEGKENRNLRRVESSNALELSENNDQTKRKQKAMSDYKAAKSKIMDERAKGMNDLESPYNDQYDKDGKLTRSGKEYFDLRIKEKYDLYLSEFDTDSGIVDPDDGSATENYGSYNAANPVTVPVEQFASSEGLIDGAGKEANKRKTKIPLDLTTKGWMARNKKQNESFSKQREDRRKIEDNNEKTISDLAAKIRNGEKVSILDVEEAVKNSSGFQSFMKTNDDLNYLEKILKSNKK